MRPGASILAAVVALALLPSNAAAAGRWMVTGRTTLPSDYWQGVAFDGAGAAWFAGPSVGLYRTSPRLAEEARVASALSPGEPFNHIGDLEWDGREGGRLLLPLECYNPFASPTNTCGIGAVGVADPIGLGRRYTVQLAGVPKAMWLALAPDGVVWTQAGTDLLGFSADAITAGAGPLQPVRRLAGALPEQVTGAAVLDGLLYTAVQAGPSLLRLYAVDLATGHRDLEAEQRLTGESEGLAAFPGFGGTLHWLVAPGVPSITPATYGRSNSVLLHLLPHGAPRPAGVQRLSRLRLAITPRRPAAGRRVTVHMRGTASVVGRTVPADGARVRAGDAETFLDARGRGRLRLRTPARGSLVVRASRPALRPARVLLRLKG